MRGRPRPRRRVGEGVRRPAPIGNVGDHADDDRAATERIAMIESSASRVCNHAGLESSDMSRERCAAYASTGALSFAGLRLAVSSIT